MAASIRNVNQQTPIQRLQHSICPPPPRGAAPGPPPETRPSPTLVQHLRWRSRLHRSCCWPWSCTRRRSRSPEIAQCGAAAGARRGRASVGGRPSPGTSAQFRHVTVSPRDRAAAWPGGFRGKGAHNPQRRRDAHRVHRLQTLWGASKKAPTQPSRAHSHDCHAHSLDCCTSSSVGVRPKEREMCTCCRLQLRALVCLLQENAPLSSARTGAPLPGAAGGLASEKVPQSSVGR
jgi:hypothetical protein